MYSEARIANLKKRYDPHSANVTRRKNLLKGLHPASGQAFVALARVHALGPRLPNVGPPGSSAPTGAEASAPLERPTGASLSCAVQGLHLSRLAELSQLEAAYEAACVAPDHGQAACFAESLEDDEVVFGWDS